MSRLSVKLPGLELKILSCQQVELLALEMLARLKNLI